MSDNLSEEEQIEAFKQWWVDNGLKLVAAAVIAIGGTLSWQGWQGSQQEYAEQGSAIYSAMIDIATTETDQPLTDEQKQDINASADQLKQDFSDTGYAHLSALLKAKLAVNADELERAASELQWVLDNDPAEEIRLLASLRLARVEAAKGNAEKALALLDEQDAGKLTSAYEEAKGDFHLSMGHLEAAYSAYQLAIETEQSENSTQLSILRLKLSQAKPVAEAEETQGES
ncbi:tetratricopeptide repeat protein [Porticoccaceae bacterium]|nr:tetratricopeptide repeat protein [Porticoccaceae bacterium]MDA9014706.1 tetratricopeptide repeat protein [Porticoccaceae bacterium]